MRDYLRQLIRSWSSLDKEDNASLSGYSLVNREYFFCSDVELKRARQLCMQKMLIHGCFSNGFIFAWSDDDNICGFCRAEKDNRVISLSRQITFQASEDEVLEIILHEIAHALDFIRHGRWRYKYILDSNGKRKRSYLIHDKVWKGIARELGIFNPKSCIVIQQKGCQRAFHN